MKKLKKHVNDIDDTAYLDADGNVNKDFPFLCEVDSGAEDILLEVNIGREAAKSGLPPEELHDAIVKLSAKKSLHIRGLMAIPPVADEKTKNSNYFTEMRQVFIDILTKKYDNVDMDYLSMGMTNDFETAIACGANMVRVGTAIFGKRPYQIVSP